jgi:hypothetical protein
MDHWRNGTDRRTPKFGQCHVLSTLAIGTEMTILNLNSSCNIFDKLKSLVGKGMFVILLTS